MKHKDLIIAWANGAQIQMQDAQGWWWDIGRPIWDVDSAYRIKPEPKPDAVRHTLVFPDTAVIVFDAKHRAGDNLKLTFDGETGALKSAEVIKC
jgi:hypothetical protein